MISYTLDEIIRRIKEREDSGAPDILISIEDAMKLVKEIEKYRNYYDRHQKFK